MKKILAVSSFLTFTIASIISFLHINNIFHVGQLTASIFWWAFVLEIFIFALYKKSLTTWILVAMIIGIRIGFDFKEVALNLGVLSKVFLKLIKTVIGPILFSTLVVGIAGHANLKQLGRMGWKSLLYFEVVTTLALAVGLIAINISQAGVGVTLPAGYHHDLRPRL